MKTFASVVKHALAIGAALAVASGAAAAQERRGVPARECTRRMDSTAEKPAIRVMSREAEEKATE